MPKFSDILGQKFQFAPTSGQRDFFQQMDSFLEDKGNNVFLLRGYAGTGKTTIVSALVSTLPLFNYKFLLLAPTGRAAKVMSQYSGRSAFTIHKIIYKQVADPSSGELSFKLQKSYNRKTLFIVDEASMLSDSNEFGTPGVLQDLLKFAFTNKDNKVLLIGDSAQLPPVGQSESTALSKDYYERKGYEVNQVELTEVMRQELDSGILYNATNLRNSLRQEKSIKFLTRGYQDIFKMGGEKMEDGLRYCYENYGTGNTIIICRSNKNAVKYNLFIRRQIHFSENELDVGDILMVVRNNYFYSPEGTPSGFIANGDFLEIMKIYGFEEMHGFRFANLSLRFYGLEEAAILDAKVMLDTLYSDAPSLTQTQNRDLYQKVAEDYTDLETIKARREAIRKDEYLNALQVKFAYALTCHKSQGGQWDAVFVDQGYVKEEQMDDDFIRWLYTAVTRATQALFLLNFKAEQFEN